MLNTKKLLYILPDVTYVAELLPGKKEHSFAIQSFRQINGTFLDDDNLIAENIEKLMAKIEAEEYHIILPDFLFTNTIVEVAETSETKAIQYVKEKLLPNLEMNKDTHEFSITVLTQHLGKYKIQLSALEKEAVLPIAQSAKAHNITISAVSPLSWTLKAVISLEPSISVVQVGGMLYAALHYIGIDQTTTAKTDEIDNIVETIKTLKGAEPSIQTVYLLTNELVETNLKATLSGTLPIQQLATFKEEDTQMPSYVRHLIESNMKTLDIADFPVPRFSLPAVTAAMASAAQAMVAETTDLPDIEEVSVPKPVAATLDTAVHEANPLPTPNFDLPKPQTQLSAPIDPTLLTPPTPPVPAPVATEVAPVEPSVTATPVAVSEESLSPSEVVAHSNVTPVEDIISTFAATPEAPKEAPKAEVSTPSPVIAAAPAPMSAPTPAKSTVIKNQNGVSPMLKMIFIGLAVFAVTVAAGVGLTLGLLTLTQNKDTLSETPLVTSPTPIASPVATATPAPTATGSAKPATGSAQTTAKTQKILVVNATTTAGYAGKTKTSLEKAGYKGVKAANAKGTYEPGTYLLLPAADATLTSQLGTDSGLTLTTADGFTVEDPKAEFDAVIVLAE